MRCVLELDLTSVRLRGVGLLGYKGVEEYDLHLRPKVLSGWWAQLRTRGRLDKDPELGRWFWCTAFKV